MTSSLMTSFFQWINFIIKPQYKFAIFCENLKILCRVVPEILDQSHYLLDDPRIVELMIADNISKLGTKIITFCDTKFY